MSAISPPNSDCKKYKISLFENKGNFLLPEVVYRVNVKEVKVILIGGYHDTTEAQYSDLLLTLKGVLSCDGRDKNTHIICEKNLPTEKIHTIQDGHTGTTHTYIIKSDSPFNDVRLSVPDSIFRKWTIFKLQFLHDSYSEIREKIDAEEILSAVKMTSKYCIEIMRQILDLTSEKEEVIELNTILNEKGMTSIMYEINFYKKKSLTIDRDIRKNIYNIYSELLSSMLKELKFYSSNKTSLVNYLRHSLTPLFDVPCLIDIYDIIETEKRKKNNDYYEPPIIFVFSGFYHTCNLLFILLKYDINLFRMELIQDVNAKNFNIIVEKQFPDEYRNRTFERIFTSDMTLQDFVNIIKKEVGITDKCLFMGGNQSLVAILFGMLIFLIIILILYIMSTIYEIIKYTGQINNIEFFDDRLENIEEVSKKSNGLVRAVLVNGGLQWKNIE